MISEKTANEWLKIAHDEWLFGSDYSSNLREPTRKIVEQMEQAVEKADNATAEQLMTMLRGLSSRFSQDQPGLSKPRSYEMAETLVECARATYRMGEKLTALLLYDESAQKYMGNDHCRAVVMWMLGCIQWQFSTRLEEAIVSWEYSIELFKRLEDRSNRAEFAEWYKYWSEEMRVTLRWAIAGADRLPPSRKAWPIWPGASPKTKPSIEEEVGTSTKNMTYQDLGNDFLRSFAVYTSIPAGGFTSSPKPNSYAELEHLCIDGIDHYVQTLNEGKRVNLLDKQAYVLVQVQGDSMDLAGIRSGDYVLLRVQDTADNGDIVAFEVNATLDEGESTLKQFFRRNGKIILQPQSRNPRHQPFELTESTYDFHIRGVGIAVFKKTP